MVLILPRLPVRGHFRASWLWPVVGATGIQARAAATASSSSLPLYGFGNTPKRPSLFRISNSSRDNEPLLSKTFAAGFMARIWRRASPPFMRGMSKARITRETFSEPPALYHSMHSIPLAAAATRYPCAFKRVWARKRMWGSSSAMRMRARAAGEPFPAAVKSLSIWLPPGPDDGLSGTVSTNSVPHGHQGSEQEDARKEGRHAHHSRAAREFVTQACALFRRCSSAAVHLEPPSIAFLHLHHALHDGIAGNSAGSGLPQGIPEQLFPAGAGFFRWLQR